MNRVIIEARRHRQSHEQALKSRSNLRRRIDHLGFRQYLPAENSGCAKFDFTNQNCCVISPLFMHLNSPLEP
jgi:hypothetical protein